MLVSGNHRRPSGTPPYWPAGEQIVWREGDGPLGTGATVIDTSGPHFAQPVTVVRDDPDALVVWLPIGYRCCGQRVLMGWASVTTRARCSLLSL